MSRLELAMRVVLEFAEAFNRADIAGMQAMIAEDCLLEASHPAPGGTEYTGRESIVGYWQDLFQKSPQVHLEVEDIFGAGSHCVLRWRRQWVDSDEEARSLRGVALFLVRDQTIHEIRSYTKNSN